MMKETDFLTLIEENHGIQVTLGFRDDVDHFIGGTGGKFWYFVKKKSTEDYYVCTRDGDSTTDVHFTRKKKVLSSEPAPSGKTMELILSELSAGQEEIESSGRKPMAVKLYEHPCSHYSFAFGERAYKISDEYGITVEYSNLKDEAAGFRLRNIATGDEVIPPKEQ